MVTRLNPRSLSVRFSPDYAEGVEWTAGQQGRCDAQHSSRERDTIKNLEKSLAKARADLTRAMKAHAVCLVHHNMAGCEAEAAALASAERHVRALEHRLAEARRVDGGGQRQAETTSVAYWLLYE